MQRDVGEVQYYCDWLFSVHNRHNSGSLHGPDRAGKNLGFLEIFFRFLGFLGFLGF